MNSVRNFCIFVLTHGRPKFLKARTLRSLEKAKTSAPVYAIVSDDDPCIGEYGSLQGLSGFVQFSRNEVRRMSKTDTMCAMGEGEPKTVLEARNFQFEAARRLGFRWFIVLDDDYGELLARFRMKRKDGSLVCPNISFNYMGMKGDSGRSVFDECCESCFRILESAPWLWCVSWAQNGDFGGGASSKGNMLARKWNFKSMNVFCCDTEKAYPFHGIINEDVCTCVRNQMNGILSLTVWCPAVNQESTQQASGGLTDAYRTWGTYFKSFLPVLASPACVKVSMLGNYHPRPHHSVDWASLTPKVVDGSFCKGSPVQADRHPYLDEGFGKPFSGCLPPPSKGLSDSLDRFF